MLTFKINKNKTAFIHTTEMSSDKCLVSFETVMGDNNYIVGQTVLDLPCCQVGELYKNVLASISDRLAHNILFNEQELVNEDSAQINMLIEFANNDGFRAIANEFIHINS